MLRKTHSQMMSSAAVQNKIMTIRKQQEEKHLNYQHYSVTISQTAQILTFW